MPHGSRLTHAWRPACLLARAVQNFVYRCDRHDPVIPRDCLQCEHRQVPEGTPERGSEMRQPKQAGKMDAADRLADMGFTRVPSTVFDRTIRRGKFLGVSTAGGNGKPYRLTISRELVAAAELEKGDTLDVFFKGKQLALVVGDGPMVLSVSGSQLAVTCPLLFEKLEITAAQRFPADYKDGVIFADLGGGG